VSQRSLSHLLIFVLAAIISPVSCVLHGVGVSNDEMNPVVVASGTRAVEICELLRHPQKYTEVKLRIKAIYRYGFEWSELYTLKCPDVADKTVLFEASREKICAAPGPLDQMDSAGMGGRTFGIIAVGRLVKLERRGSNNCCADYKFVADCLESAESLDKTGQIPGALAPEDRERILRFEENN
jgi:hypothetical protein